MISAARIGRQVEAPAAAGEWELGPGARAEIDRLLEPPAEAGLL